MYNNILIYFSVLSNGNEAYEHREMLNTVRIYVYISMFKLQNIFAGLSAVINKKKKKMLFC